MNHRECSKRVGIVTLTQAENYGTALQAYATLKIFQRVAPSLDFGLVPTDWRVTRWREYINMMIPRPGRNPIDRFSNYFAIRHFIDPELDHGARYLNIGRPEVVVSYLRENYAALLTGSDEIWNLKYRGSDEVYVSRADLGMYRAAYATSANRIRYRDLSIQTRKKLGRAFDEYDRIYVRDRATLAIVQELSSEGERASLIIDPTLTYDFSEIPRVGESLRAKSGRKRILVMATSSTVVDSIVDRFGTEADIDSIFRGHKGTRFRRLTPVEFVRVFEEYDVVATQFFHGTCMSIRSGRPFIAFDVDSDYPGVESKIGSLLNTLGMRDNYARVLPSSPGPVVDYIERALEGGANIADGARETLELERQRAWSAAQDIGADLQRSLLS